MATMKQNRRGIVIDANGSKVGSVEALPDGQKRFMPTALQWEIAQPVRIVWCDFAPDLADYPAVVIV